MRCGLNKDMWDFRKYYENIALKDDKGNVITYKQLDEMQESFSRNINGRLLVFLLCTNTIECIITYVSCIMHKIPIMLIDESISDDNLRKLMNDYEPRYMYQDGKLIEVVKKEGDDMHPELGLLLSTSGSTGASKCVRISYNNLQSNTKAIVSELGIRSNDITITSLSMNYCYGLSVINTHLWAGATVLVTKEKIISSKFWKFATDENVTTFAGVPYTYEILRKLKILDNFHFNKLLQAGGKLDRNLEEFLRRYSVEQVTELYLMYGQTEATARMSVFKVDSDSHYGSVGKAIVGGRFEIVSDKDDKVDCGRLGEIIYYGENVSMGYACSRNDLLKGDENKGRLATGDIGYKDKNGYLYVTSRKDKMVKINGLRVDLESIESRLKERHGYNFEIEYDGNELFVKGELFVEDIREFVSKLIGINKIIIKFIKKDVMVKGY